MGVVITSEMVEECMCNHSYPTAYPGHLETTATLIASSGGKCHKIDVPVPLVVQKYRSMGRVDKSDEF